MFERYTEAARRTLFFSRYEASQLGSVSIEAEHLLLGLIREEKGHPSRLFEAAHLSFDNVGEEIRRRTQSREKPDTAVEIPFSAETKRILQFAADESDNLLHNYIGPEHLCSDCFAKRNHSLPPSCATWASASLECATRFLPWL